MNKTNYIYKEPVQEPINPPYKKALLKTRGMMQDASTDAESFPAAFGDGESDFVGDDSDDETEKYSLMCSQHSSADEICVSNNLVEELSSELRKFIIDDDNSGAGGDID